MLQKLIFSFSQCDIIIDIINFVEIKSDYKKLQKVFCPYLEEGVSFNSKGLRHLMYKNTIRKRNEKDVLERSKHFEKARRIIEITTSLQEVEKINASENNKSIKII